MKNIVLVALVTLMTFSCTSKQKEVNKPVVVEQAKEVEKEFIVNMSFKTSKEDNFRLMLNNIEVDEFQKKNIIIIEKVSPSSEIDKLTANFGYNISKNFSINLGNKEVKEVEINSVEILYGNNKISVKSDELNEYFTFNKFVVQDTVSNKFQTKKIKGQHSPTITLRRKAINQLTIQ